MAWRASTDNRGRRTGSADIDSELQITLLLDACFTVVAVPVDLHVALLIFSPGQCNVIFRGHSVCLHYTFVDKIAFK